MTSTFELFGLSLSFSTLTLGLCTGMAYGLLAVGLVLVYRSNKIINFAHGEIGAFGAAVFGVAVVNWGVPYWLALPGALLLAAGIGGVAEVAVIRRLRKAPKLMSLVASLGLAQLLLFLSLVVNTAAVAGSGYPQPAGLPSWHIGAFLLTRAYVGLLLISPMVVIALVLFLRLSRYGLAMRASAANPEAARMAGVFAARMSTLAWAIAGSVACLTAILLKPTLGFATAAALGPNLLLRALVAAVIARMVSLPIALGAGIAVGIIEQVLAQSYPSAGLVEVVLFGLILGALLLQTRRGGRDEEKGSWSAVLPWGPLSARVRASGIVRRLGTGTGVAFIVVLLLLTAVITNQTATTLVIILAVSIIGLSLGIITGLAGQLSLGQFALAGVGATVSARFTTQTGNFPVGFLLAGAAAAAVSVLIGLPALRIRGLLLAVTTLGFALASERFFLMQDWMLGAGLTPGRPIFADHALDTGRSYYQFGVIVFALCLLLCRNIWRSGLARKLRALRDNEDGARAFGIPASRTKLETFALAGFVAGVGGALFGHTLSFLRAGDFSVTANVNIIAMSVIGGIGLLAGPVLGALYIIGVPRFVPISSGGLAASSFGWLILILYFPGGLAQLMAPLRERGVRWAARIGPGAVSSSTPIVVEEHAGPADPDADDEVVEHASHLTLGTPATARAATAARPRDEVLLSVSGLAKSFGGVHAVDGVDLAVRRGETLGLIGPNGAGKTTLFEMLGGFTRPDAGTVTFAGNDVSRLSPERRAHVGIIRSFQDAGLFPTLTVLETVQLAQERSAPTRTWASLAGARKADRAKEERARELIALMGLEDYIDKQTGELSTGTRRITELTCVIALEPELLLLDEPSSGVAQRETEALGALLEKVKTHLDATLIVIEHDMPLIMGISDRIVAMDSGRIIAEGTPAEVIADPAVLESYLGGSAVAVGRSGTKAARTSTSKVATSKAAASKVAVSNGHRCEAVTRSNTRCRRAAVADGLCVQHAATLTGASR